MNDTRFPNYLSRFIGRSHQIRELVELIKTNRLVTVNGTGGIGKTRIAVALITEIQDFFSDGIYFVDLSSILEEAHIPDAIVQSLNIEGYNAHSGIKNTLHFLSNKECLLILDNYEQLAFASSTLLALLGNCPNLKILITSRIILNIPGEQVFSLPPLSFDYRDNTNEILENESVLLFDDRAKHINHTFKIGDGNRETIIKICQYLGGIPLSLEVAAANLKIFSPQQLLERINSILDLPNQDSTLHQQSHKSLRNTIDWSYQLLTKSEQSFFQNLTIFKNGFSLEAVEFLFAHHPINDLTPVNGLTVLINKSLLTQKVNNNSEIRFYFLDTIHFYALELLKSNTQYYACLERTHAHFFVDWAEKITPELKGRNQSIWLEHLQAEVPNFRSAMQWILANKEAELGLRLGAALWRFWFIRSMRAEGLTWFNQVMQLNTGLLKNENLANALEGIGLLQAQLVSPEEGLAYLKKSLKIGLDLKKPVMAANLMNHISWLLFRFSDYEEAQKYALDAYSVHFQERNEPGMALSNCNLGWIAFIKGNFKEALNYIQKEKPLHFEMGDLRNYSYALIREAWVNILMGAYETALEGLTEAIDNLEQLKEGQLTAFGKHILGKLYAAQGQFDTAYQCFDRAEKLFKNTHDTVFIAFTYCSKSQACLAMNRLEQAEHLMALASNIFSIKGENINRISEFYSTLGYLEWEKHHYLDAAKWFKHALQHNHKKGEKFYLVQNIEWLAKYALNEKQYALATKLLAFCSRFRTELHMPLFPFEKMCIEKLDYTLQDNLSSNPYKNLCKEGQNMILEQAVLLACSLVPSSKIETNSEKDMQFLLTIQETINARLDQEDFDTDFLCKAMSVSRTKLHKKIKALTGQSTAEYIRKIRMNKAKVLLETSDIPVGVIASQVGFKDFSHFSRTFLKEFNKNPSEIRRLYKI
jgi:predicted ATPase/AraC-like DNA-binding protein